MNAMPPPNAAPVFRLTEFKDFGAATKHEESFTLPSLAARVAAVTASQKSRLPWLKLATFGDRKTEKGSLRHDANVLRVTGLEADYDGGELPFDHFVDTLRIAGVAALVYTSPSHTPDAPRCRVVCPFSTDLPPDQRERMLGRLNGLFRGVFAGESWTLSQAYYYGSVNSNPAHQVEVIEGVPIDLMPELDSVWVGRPHTGKAGTAAGGEPRAGRVNEGDLLREIISGASYHSACVRILGKWAREDVPYMDARRRVLEAFDAVFPPDRDERWAKRRADVDRCLEAIYGKEARARDEGRRESDGRGEPGPGAGGGGKAPSSIDELVDRFNERYLVVNEAGKALVYQVGRDPVLKRRRFDRLTFLDLKNLYLNERVEVGRDEQGRPVVKNAADVWLRHERRRQYIHGVTFDPSDKGTDPGVLNLWEGFNVRPAPGDWSLLREHVRAVICGGDAGRFSYMMGWMARMVQRPAEQGEVAVVMKGGEGTGKGTLAKALLHIMGQHGLGISNSKHLVGNFNGHLRDVVFLFADEALFAGDRAHVGVLKSLITEPYLTVEGKFQNAVQSPNFLHVLMASNEEWVVPASQDARRYFVLEVDDDVRGNHAYFKRIWAQMEAGGYEAMLHDLLAYDLTGFNVRAVPITEGLQQQKKLSLGTTEGWWLDCLERGYVFRSKLGLEEYFGRWHPKVTTELLFESYQQFAKAKGERRPLTREQLGKFLTGIKATPCRGRGGVIGERVVVAPDLHGRQERRPELLKGTDRPPAYDFGTLDTARAAFLEATGLTVTWDGGDCREDDHEDDHDRLA